MIRIIMFALLAIPLISLAQDDCRHGFRGKDLGTVSTLKLSQQFQKWRDENNACHRKWKSDLQLMMEELGTRLAASRVRRKEILKFMGTPDHESDALDMIKLNTGEHIMVYHWRGWHDWMYFVIRKNRVVRMKWWYAYE